jgi:cholera toxin transcriptional activator
MGSVDRKIFRFGVFEADASTGELRKAGIRVRLQEQPFQVLMLFLEHPEK